jgi:hypothetical protein
MIFEYCMENNVITTEKRHIRDHIKNQNKLQKRGWSVDEDDLIEEIVHTLCNITKIEKAKITFSRDGTSKEKLTYAVVGEHDGYSGKLAFHFNNTHSQGGSIEQILIVTVLLRKKIKESE